MSEPNWAQPRDNARGGSAWQSMMAETFRRTTEALTALDGTLDVSAWAKAKFGVDLWSLQRGVLESVVTNPRTAVWSCHDAGKSFAAALAVCHHIDRYPARQARAITTAPSNAQVRGVLWVEINGLHERAKENGQGLPGRVNQTEWWIGSYMAGIGRKPNEYKPEQFAGFHARYPLVVLDEADGMPPEMWEGVEALLTNRKAKLFCIGNPLDGASHFAQVRSAWEAGDDTFHGIVIPYDSTPNFTGEPVSEYVKDVLLSTEWVENRRRTWGDREEALRNPEYQPLDNPFWYGRVLAQYPPEDTSQVITTGHVLKSTDVDELPPTHHLSPLNPAYLARSSNPNVFRQLGVDVAASSAGDYTVCRERVGAYALRSWKKRTANDDEIEEFIVQCAQDSGAQRIVLDGTGVGFGFTGRVRRRVKSCTVTPVNFGSAAPIKQEDGKTRKFENLRAQLYWETGREGLRQGKYNVAHMEESTETITDLCSARLDTESLAGTPSLIKIESKMEIKRRLKRSPDQGEAFLLSFYEPSGTGVARMSSPRGHRIARGPAAALGKWANR